MIQPDTENLSIIHTNWCGWRFENEPTTSSYHRRNKEAGARTRRPTTATGYSCAATTRTTPEREAQERLWRSHHRLQHQSGLGVRGDADLMITTASDLYGFFLERVTPLAPQFGVNPTEAVYLANLLAARSQPQRGPSTLFDLYKKAVEEGGQTAALSYKEIGDRSLFMVGVFPNYFNGRRAVSESYYRNMGKGAYRSLASLLSDKRFETLSESFNECVKLIRATMTDVRWSQEDDINDLYEKWLIGEDPTVEKRVRRLAMPLKVYKA